MGSVGRLRFQCDQHALVRAVHHSALAVPAWPDLADTTPAGIQAWRVWMRQVWQIPELADAVRFASPSLARELDSVERDSAVEESSARRMLLSLAGYCLRLEHRPAPFGLFAGITEGMFADRTAVRWGTGHRAVARGDGGWLADVVGQLEAMPEVRERLTVVTNNIVTVRGYRLVVPWKPRRLGTRKTTETRETILRWSAEVGDVVEMAVTPVAYRDLVAKLTAEHQLPDVSVARGLLDELIAAHVLLTSLQPPATVIDALGYVVERLESTGAAQTEQAAELAAALREIHQAMAEHNQLPAAGGGGRRQALVERMTERSADEDMLAVDLRLDGEVRLPRQVAWEAEAAATTLARISPEPYGTPQWQAYRQRFLRRYGPVLQVPLLELVNPTTGIGLPDGFHGTPHAARPAFSRRDAVLLARAQRAVMDGSEIELDEALVAQLAVGDPARMQLPPHLELLIEVHARSAADLDAGRFELQLRNVSRGWGNLSGGRFAALLAAGPPSSLLKALARRPAGTSGAVPVQLSFPALAPWSTHITRVPQLVPDLISISEHRPPRPGTIALSDLAVLYDGDLLHLVSRSRGQILEAATPQPLQIEYQTPALARFLDEIVRGQRVRMARPTLHTRPFDWGAARWLPSLPRVRHGRTVLSPASWQLDPGDLPGRGAGPAEWEEKFTAARIRLGVPDAVQMERFDHHLPLDLSDPGHLALLRSHLERPKPGSLVLTEGVPEGAHGWSDGRATEIVTLLRAATQARAPQVTRSAPVHRRAGHLPGASRYLCARLFGQPTGRRDLVTDHLPALLDDLGEPAWWFNSADTAEPFLELCVRLEDMAAYGEAASVLGRWVEHLVETGALGGLALVPYRTQLGGWGSALGRAAEGVFAADCAALQKQLTFVPGAGVPVLPVANVLRMAASFNRSADAGLRWLAARPKDTGRARLPRDLPERAAALMSCADNWSEVRALPGGSHLVEFWDLRHNALNYCRSMADEQSLVDADAVLEALLEAQHLRAVALGAGDEDTRHLARAVAVAQLRNPSAGRTVGEGRG